MASIKCIYGRPFIRDPLQLQNSKTLYPPASVSLLPILLMKSQVIFILEMGVAPTRTTR